MEWKDWGRKNATPSSREVVCTSNRPMMGTNLSMEIVEEYHARGCLRLCKAYRGRVYQGENPVEKLWNLVLSLQF